MVKITKTKHAHRILILMLFMFLLLWSIPSNSQGTFILNADDIEAKKWMELPAQSRASFIFGFLAGLDHVYNSTGMLVTLTRPLSAKELSKEVYKVLLKQPELRSGPIDEIILTSLDQIVSITNKAGSRVSPGMREISTETKKP